MGDEGPGTVGEQDTSGGSHDADTELRRCAAAGVFCDLTDWPDEARRVSSSVLCDVCAGDPAPIHPNGVRLRGAVIAGGFDLQFAKLGVPFQLEECVVLGVADLSWARVPAVRFLDCQFTSLTIRGTVIDVVLTLSGAIFTGSDSNGYSLNAAGVRVAGDAHLFWINTESEEAGGVRLRNAVIGGTLQMGGAKLAGTDPEGYSLYASDLRVGASAFLNAEGDEQFEARGAVILRGADIGGRLHMGGAKLTGTAGDDHYSLDVTGVRVGADAYFGTDTRLGERFEAAGALRLAGATIGGSLSLQGAKLAGTDPSGYSLQAAGLRVGSDAYLGDGLETTGGVGLAGTVIGGELDMRGAERLGRLDLSRCTAGGFLGVDLTSPVVDRIVLRGFGFATVGEGDWKKQRETWLSSQAFGVDWSPDPYEQLAAYYTRSGDEDAARRIRIARNDDELKHLRKRQGPQKWRSLPYRMWRRGLWLLVGYGYRRWPAGLLLVLSVLLAGGVFLWAENADAMVPNQPAGASECGEAYPCFNSWVYGADVVLPIVDFGQDTAWRPTAAGEGGQWWVRARWIFIAVGWVLASVFVAAFTRVVQRD